VFLFVDCFFVDNFCKMLFFCLISGKLYKSHYLFSLFHYNTIKLKNVKGRASYKHINILTCKHSFLLAEIEPREIHEVIKIIESFFICL